jgi:hypothetical protein
VCRTFSNELEALIEDWLNRVEHKKRDMLSSSWNYLEGVTLKHNITSKPMDNVKLPLTFRQDYGGNAYAENLSTIVYARPWRASRSLLVRPKMSGAARLLSRKVL